MATVGPFLGSSGSAAFNTGFNFGVNMFKRRRRQGGGTADDTNAQARPHNHAGGPAFQFRKGQTKTTEPGAKKGRLARLLAEHKLKETSVIGRFQYLTAGAYAGSTDVTFGYPLCKRWTGGTPGAEGAGNSMDLPVYAFNLSSMCFSENSSSKTTCPFYRLNKIQRATAADDATQWNYRWYKQEGQLNTNPATLKYDWTLERQTGTNYLTNNHYFWKWSDIELGFKTIEGGAPRKVHVALVKFHNPATGPRREYYDGGGFVPWDGDVVDMKLCSESDLWYENWLARKLVHPLRRVEKYTTSHPIKFLKYECICLEPGGGLGFGSVFTQKIFHTANKLMSCVDPTLAETQHLTNINTGISGTFIPARFNTNLQSASQAAFPAKHKDTWLMIWADDFEKPQASGGTFVPPLSFDLMIRSKFALTKM